MAVYAPALMLQDGTWLDTAYIVFKAMLAIGLWGAASIGHLRTGMSWPERILAATAAGFLVVALPVTDEIGFGLAAAFLGWHFWRSRRIARTDFSR
jgi:TRAP-type uncharacterized transport system fused permease subunit